HPPVAGARLLGLGEIDGEIAADQVASRLSGDQLSRMIDIGYLAIGADRHQRIEARLDQASGILRGRAKLLLRLPLLRDVTADDQVADRIARRVIAARYDDAGREARAILAHAPELRLRDTLVVRDCHEFLNRT